jgi:hypothetical protein
MWSWGSLGEFYSNEMAVSQGVVLYYPTEHV